MILKISAVLNSFIAKIGAFCKCFCPPIVGTAQFRGTPDSMRHQQRKQWLSDFESWCYENKRHVSQKPAPVTLRPPSTRFPRSCKYISKNRTIFIYVYGLIRRIACSTERCERYPMLVSALRKVLTYVYINRLILIFSSSLSSSSSALI